MNTVIRFVTYKSLGLVNSVSQPLEEKDGLFNGVATKYSKKLLGLAPLYRQ